MLIASATAHLGRAILLAGFLAAFFGAFAAAIGARRNDPRTLRLVPRFVALASFMALAAFAVMCPSTPYWQRTLADTVGKLVTEFVIIIFIVCFFVPCVVSVRL